MFFQLSCQPVHFQVLLIIKDKKIYMQAGAGIVADSIPKNEYEESHNKVRALVKTIGGEV